MRRAFVAVGLFTCLFVAVGCSPSCEDACDRLAECGTRLNPESVATPEQLAECVSECESGICGEAQQDAEKNTEALDCIADLDCDSESSARDGLLECARRCI